MNKKYVILSTNNNPDYYFYAPYQEKAWNSFGWEVCILCTHDVDIKNLKLQNESTVKIILPEIPDIRTETIAQVSRLYASNYLPLDAMIMTSDMDLIPLSDYWKQKKEDITIYGYDLTDFTTYPMGYIAMTGHNWKKYFNCTYNIIEDITRDINEYRNIAMSPDWNQWWGYDQILLTDRLILQGANVTHIHRGRRDSGFAHGRIDRGDGMKNIDGQLIDMHCENNNVMHPDKLNKFLTIFNSNFK